MVKMFFVTKTEPFAMTRGFRLVRTLPMTSSSNNNNKLTMRAMRTIRGASMASTCKEIFSFKEFF